MRERERERKRELEHFKSRARGLLDLSEIFDLRPKKQREYGKTRKRAHLLSFFRFFASLITASSRLMEAIQVDDGELNDYSYREAGREKRACIVSEIAI